MKTTTCFALLALSLSLLAPAAQVSAQGFPQSLQFSSTEVSPERKLTFRVLAPKATDVRLGAGDIPGLSRNPAR